MVIAFLQRNLQSVKKISLETIRVIGKEMAQFW
jgi:hypothetical protein